MQDHPDMDARNDPTETKDEEERNQQQVLDHFHRILDMAGEEEFDQLLDIATEVSGASFSLLSFVDKEGIRIQSNKGIELSHIPAEHSICQHVFQGKKPVHIEDLSQDPILKDSPLVKGHPYLRGYLGVPIIDRDGNTWGSLCLAETTPASFKEKDERILQKLASQAMRLLESQFRKKEGKEAEKELSKRILDTEEKLRDRIGREIHDDIAQDLAGGNFFLQELYNELEGIDNERIPEYMHNVQVSLKQAIQKSRDLSHEMKLKKLDRSGLVEGIRSLLLPLDGRNGALSAHFHGELDESQIPRFMKKNIYRIVQEILNNALKHSGGGRLFIRIKEFEGRIHLDSWDNGKGMRAVEDEHSELRSIRSRAEALGGRVRIESYPRKGLSYDIAIPLS